MIRSGSHKEALELVESIEDEKASSLIMKKTARLFVEASRLEEFLSAISGVENDSKSIIDY